jgi:hypothetical protein
MIQKMLRGESFQLYPQYLDRTNPVESSCWAFGPSYTNFCKKRCTNSRLDVHAEC